MNKKPENHQTGTCLNCGKPTKRHHSAKFCWDCSRLQELKYRERTRIRAAERKKEKRDKMNAQK